MVKSAQNQTLVPGVAAALRDRILSGALLPGTVLHQAALAETLGVSLIPLREALRVLEADGLVEFTAHKGVHVASVSPEEVFEWSLEVRALIGVILPIAIPAMGEPVFARLRQIVLEEPTTLGTIQAFFTSACASCGMPRLLRRVEQLLTQFGRYLPAGGGTVMAHLWNHPPTLKDLLKVLETRDAERALKDFEAYLMPWVEEFKRRLEPQP